MLEKIIETAEFIQSHTDNYKPVAGIILGSGLGKLTEKINIRHVLNYADIINFPVSTVQGHGSRLILGELNGVPVVAMQGRLHYYEGFSMSELTFPVRVMKYLGIEKLLLSNASGGVNPDYKTGDLMIIDDHINLMGTNPLIGANIEEFGPRFPDMSAPYDHEMIKHAAAIAAKNNYRCHVGVYAAVTGPTFETRAEYKYIRIIGADAVGMSTIPEVIVARHMNIPCFAVSIITDLGGSDHVEVVTHEEVLKVAATAEVKLTQLVSELLVK